MLRKTLSAVIPLYFNFKKIKLKIISHKVVISGPFVGMKYVSQSIGSAYVCKILGTYEKEIQEYVLAPQLSSFDVFINIGSGEGYYAVGVAINNPNLNVIAFESNKIGRTLIKQLALLNKVEDKVQIYGQCKTPLLESVLVSDKRIMLLIDVEGDEIELLHSKMVNKLRFVTILVEIHDFIDNSLGDTLYENYRKTHFIEIIHIKKRRTSDFPLSFNWFQMAFFRITNQKKNIILSMDERRPNQLRWFYLEPRDSF